MTGAKSVVRSAPPFARCQRVPVGASAITTTGSSTEQRRERRTARSRPMATPVPELFRLHNQPRRSSSTHGVS